MPKQQPPILLLRFFRWFCNPDYVEDIEGDLLERFVKRTNENKAARWLFTWDVFRLFRPGIIKNFTESQKLNYYDMFRNYFKVSLRSIIRHKTFSFLNITGLSVGIASCILILIYVNNELSYDTYNSQYGNTYRVIQYFGNQEEIEDYNTLPKSNFIVWGNAPVAPAIREYFPEVQSVFRFTSPNPWLISYKEKTFTERNVVFGDSTAFEVFDWPILAGDPKTALVRPNTIVLTKRLARKYFGDEDPLGQTLIMDSDEPFEVTGVIEIPTNSHFSFDAMISMTSFHNRRPEIFENWSYVDFYTYFTIMPQTDIGNLSERVPAFLEKNLTSDFNYYMRFESLADAYLYSESSRTPGQVGSLSNIYVFSSAALFILLIACINFMNLSTARSVERAKEVAIRKTIGSDKRALIFQFLVEAVIVSFSASVVAMALILLGHPYLEFLSNKSLPIDWLFTTQNVLIAAGGILLIGTLAGSYPAFVLSSFKPASVLKGSFKTSASGVWLRKSLVSFQFALSIILFIGTAVIYSQLNFLRNHELGFNPNQVLAVDFGWDFKVQQKLEYIKGELQKHPDVRDVAVSRATPGDFFPHAGTGVEEPSGELVFKGPAIYEIDEDFAKTYQMKVVAGRSFSADFPLDSANALVLNEAAAKMYGYANPADVVGKSFAQWGREGKVVGVIEDFNYVSLHDDVRPLSLRYATKFNSSMFSLRLNSNNYTRTIGELEDIWARIVPHRPFESRFVDQNFNTQYEADERFGMIFTVFSALAMFVACLGLFGLTIYSTAQRTKEIGVRKVLGASVSNLVSMLSMDFLKLFVISLLFAIPISWYLMKNWLQEFAYRISIGWEVFTLATALTLIISFVTMSLKTIGAARSNPVDALKDE